MKIDDLQPNLLQRAGICFFGISGLLLAVNSEAATAVGTASATVVESLSVDIVSPPPPEPLVVVTTPALSGTTFNVETFTTSQSTSGPLLRPVSPPPAVSAATGTEGGSGSQGATAAPIGTGRGVVPTAANSATVTVTRKADGSLSVSAGAGITIAVSQPSAGAINIEYN